MPTESKDHGIPKLIQYVKEGGDFYTSLASQLFMKPEFKISKEEKNAIKESFLSWMYERGKEIVGHDI